MFRKVMTAACLMGVGSYLWMGTSVGSYAKTGVTQVVHYFHGQVPVEFQLKRVKQMAEDLVPDIRKTRKTIAEEEVRIARLENEIQAAQKQLETERLAIVKLQGELGKGLASYKIGVRRYTSQELLNELNMRFTSYKRADSAIQTKQEILKARRVALDASREQFSELMVAKEKVAGQIADLEARHKMMEAKKVANEFQIDDSQLSRVRQLINEIDDRLTVEEKLSEEHGNLMKRVPVDEIPPADLSQQIDNYFQQESSHQGVTL